MSRTYRPLVCILAAALAARAATAAAQPAPTSLNTCQKAVKTATAAFVKNKIAALGSCLRAVSQQLVKNTAPDLRFAAAPCAVQFRKLNDSRGLGNQLSDQLAAAIIKRCAPGQANVTHTLADILGTGAGVPQPLGAENLNAWCTQSSGDGSIDSLQEWINCLRWTAECNVNVAITAQFPRAVEWLGLVRTQIEQLPAPPAADPNKLSDALAALDAVKTAIGGSNNGVPSIQCGGSATPATCGNGVKDGAGEQCDGSDLGGQNCTRLGFSGGTLSCNAACGFDPSGCGGPGALFPATGETTAYTADKNDGVAGEVAVADDGSVQAGAALAFADNGDGTITDLNTRLVWEKKDAAGGLHDRAATYVWSGDGSQETIWDWLDDVNAEGGSGFAGHSDWRVPSVSELYSLVDYQHYGPAVTATFNMNCTSGCTVSTCSCTQPDAYWSSTTSQIFPSDAWRVFFGYGHSFAGGYNGGKSNSNYVRAVRGGL